MPCDCDETACYEIEVIRTERVWLRFEFGESPYDGHGDYSDFFRESVRNALDDAEELIDRDMITFDIEDLKEVPCIEPGLAMRAEDV